MRVFEDINKADFIISKLICHKRIEIKVIAPHALLVLPFLVYYEIKVKRT